MDNVEAKVREIVASVTALAADVPADANLYLDLGVASVHALNLLTELETQFGVAIPDDEFVVATSIATLSALLMTDLTQNASETSFRG
jgi:acyl carrier protein